jgi:hypothetical protein
MVISKKLKRSAAWQDDAEMGRQVGLLLADLPLLLLLLLLLPLLPIECSFQWPAATCDIDMVCC